MKRFAIISILLCIAICLLCGCGNESPEILATTMPVYEFTSRLCQGTPLQVGQLITESVSCIHDYTLQVSQMRMVESAQLIVINGAGLEDFLADVLPASKAVIDSSASCHLHGAHSDHDHNEGHHHEQDPHIWLSPKNAKIMAKNICSGLSAQYPEYAMVFNKNLETLLADLDTLQNYGDEVLAELSCRELITFHDGFAYFAEGFDLEILEAIEEESGSEASAQELKHLITLVHEHQLPAVFTEENGSVAAANVICAETGIPAFALRMAMSGEGYFEAMYHNIDTVKEALG